MIRLYLLSSPLGITNVITSVFRQMASIFPLLSLTGKMSSAFFGTAMANSLVFAERIKEFILSLAMLEREMCSVERVEEYCVALNKEVTDNAEMDKFITDLIQSEDSYEIAVTKYTNYIKEVNPFKNARTGLKLDNVVVQYRRANADELLKLDPSADVYAPPSLWNLSAFASENETVGLVGRSGAG